MSALNWHSHDETPDGEFVVAAVALRKVVDGHELTYLLDRLYRWDGENWVGLHSERRLVVEEFWWVSENDILNTLKASLGANHV